MNINRLKLSLLIVSVLFFLVNNVFSQIPTWNWANDVHSGQDEVVTGTEIDPLTGDIYTVGYWEQNLSAFFPAGAFPSEIFSSTYGNEDGFVAKYDDTGALLWAFKIGSNQDDRVNAISVDPVGNIYITGYFSLGNNRVAQFQGTNATTGSLSSGENSSDFFIAKYNSNGELLWVRQGKSTGNRDVSGEDISASNTGVFAVGYFNDDTEFGALTVRDNGSFNQHFLVSYDSNGNEQWVAYGSTNNHDYNTESYFNSVETDGTNVFLTGNFKGPNFQLYDNTDALVSTKANSNDGRAEIVLISFTVGGNFNWMQTIGGNNHDVDHGIALDNDSIYITGGIGNNASFPGYTNNPVSSSGNMDVFLSSHSKIDGVTGWVNSITCDDGGSEMGMDLTLDGYSNILLSGYYEDALNFPGNTITSVGGIDGFIASYTSTGTFYWAKTIGSNGDDAAFGVVSNSTDFAYVGGYYENTVDLDGNFLTDNGRDNIFLAQIAPCKDATGGVASTLDSDLCIGESTTISLVGSDGSIQWQSSPKAADTWTDIAGETSISFLVSPVSSTDYRAVLTPLSCNSDTSTVLTINVYPLPTATISGDASICEASNTPIDITLTGTAPYNFTYTNGTSTTNVVAHGLNNYSNNVSPADTSIYAVTAVSDGNGCANVGAGTATINVIPQLTINTQPASKNACSGANVSFSVLAIGSDLTYQWKKNGVDIVGEINPILVLNSVTAIDVATYTCVVSSSCGGPLTTNDADLTLYSATTITSNPIDAYLCTGQILNLSVTATGSNLTYQWRKDGIDIVSETANVFTIPSVTTGDIGLYTCEVTGSCNVLESNPANVQIDAPIVITTQPVSNQSCPGSNISFTVTATGTNLAYQWQKNGIDIVGETSQSLILNNIAAGNAGNYRCIISSPCGANLNTNIASLIINTTTQITAEPVDVTECLGGNASFEVTALGSNITYQWLKDGAPIVNGGSISGALSNQLIITGLAVGDAGSYKCQVSGSCGFLESLAANLIVDDAIAITTQPISQVNCEGNNIIFSVVSSGSNLVYQWQKNLVDLVGETNPTLNIISLSAADVGDYRCIVSNSCGQSLNSNEASLNINHVTVISTQPVDAVECIGNAVIFTVAAAGSNLNYQWYKDGIVMANGGDISGVQTKDLVIANLDLTDAADYNCRVTGDCGFIDSDPAILVIDDNISIATQPQDIQACENDNVAFSVFAIGSNLTYQWQKDLVDIIGATNSVLTLNNIAVGDVASYRCVISNSCGSTLNSEIVNLSLYQNTAITAQPIDETECIGQNVSFTVTVTGSNLFYQWKKNGVGLIDGGNVSGALTNTLNISGILAGDNGVYTCEVTGSCNIVNSDPANLILNTNTIITTQPTNQAVCPGANAVFNVVTAGTNLFYQWQKDGVDIFGQTNSGLIINNVAASDAGVYRCLVTGDCNSSISNGALLTVNSDVVITSQPINDEVCEDEMVGFSVIATGTGLTYQWQLNGVDLVDGGNILGSTTTNLTLNPVVLADAGIYTCIVSGTCGNQTTNPASLIVDEKTVITVQPQNKIACPNDNISFSVTVTGSNLFYQWKKDGADIVGETNSSLIINNVTALDAAVYRCEITGDCNNFTSNGASLTVNSDVIITTQPSNDKVCEGGIVGFNVSATGTALTYQWKHNGINLVDGGNISGANTINLVIDPVSIGDAGTYTCEVTGTCSSVNSDAVSLTVDESIVITTHPQNETGCPGEDIALSVVATGTNLTYQWQKDGADIGGETNSGLLLTNITALEAGVYRCVVSGDCGSVNSNGGTLIVNTGASISVHPTDEQICEGQSAGFVLSASGTGLNYQWKRNGIDLVDDAIINGSATNSLSIDPVVSANAGVYTCEIIGTCNTINSNPVNLTIDENIVITTHPSNLTACPTDNATFNIVATGTNLTYQWQKNGINIGGETNTGLSLAAVTAFDDGVYRCIVTGNCGVLNSNGATLTVNDDIIIATHPADEEICEGDNATFSINATGSSLTYQWKYNGINIVDGGSISGATTNTLNINAVTLANAGSYTCELTGTCGSQNSNPASLVVDETIVISSNPQNKTGCPGDNILFSVAATGTNLTYQWEKDGAIIIGETNAGLLLNNIATGDAAVYRCVISGDCGTLNSTGATLSVNTDISITQQPANDEICEGSNTSFVVVATGTGVTYQWKLNGVNLADGGAISGSTTSNLDINPAVLADAGVYTCEISGSCGTLSTTPANLVVDENINISAHPQNVTACPTDNANFSVAVIGTNLTYQWQKDGVNLGGETNTNLTLAAVTDANEGMYQCVITGDCGVVTSNGANLVVDEAVSITTQPIANQGICEGDNLNLTIVSTGTGLTYQWQKDGVNLINGGSISGATSDNLIISGVVVSDDGIYTCIVSGTCGSETSNLSDITVYPITAVTQHPVLYTVVEGGNADFSVVAEGNNLTYQWQKDGVDLVDGGVISGATTSILSLTGVAEANEGAYRCVVNGTCNISNSNPANLIVNPTTNITTQPNDLDRCEGESAGFSVVATGGGLTYQWQLNGVDLVDNVNITGSTTANLNINAVSLADAGAYTCIISGETSAPAILTVNENTTINTHPLAATRCEGDNIIFDVSASGSALTYQWQKDGVDLADGGTITGSLTSTLTISATAIADAGNYRCVVTGTCGIVNSNLANLIVYENTAITLQPLGSTICESDPYTFTVTSDGDNLTYQWKKDGVDLVDGGNISGSTTANLTIANSTLADAGAYTCAVSGVCGFENSVIAQLDVEASTNITLQPIDAVGCQGDNISFSILADGAGLTYQWQKDGVNLVDAGSISGATTSNLNITGIVPADDGSYVCVVTGNCGIENSDPAVLTSYANTQITTHPISNSICEDATITLTTVATGDNLTYQWRKDGVDLVDLGNISGSNTASLNIAVATLSNAGTYTCEVAGSCGTENSNLAILTVLPNTNITTHPVDASGCEGDNISFSIISDGDALSYQWQKDGANLADGGVISGATTSLLTLTGIATANVGSYRCVVTGTCGTDNTNPAILTVYNNTQITTQPIGNTICENEAYTFSVVANGDNLTYQWKKDGINVVDGGNISGATTANLSIINTTLTNAGSYTCSISGECGFENSNIAQLDIEPTTVITLQPLDANGCEGDNISFSVLASGAGLSYQWQKDGINLADGGSVSGALTQNINITGVVASDAGSYVCVVSGNCSDQNSDPAELIAFDNTQITTQPTGSNLCEGATVTLSVVAAGGNLTYQWQKDGIDLADAGNITGTTTANLNIANALLTDAGTYSCIVNGDCGTENSNLAIINVRPTTTITSQPIDKTGCDGDNISFTVLADGAGLTYQWQKDGANLVDVGIVSGSTTSLLSLSGITNADAGSYRCIVTGTCGTDNSNPAILTAYQNTAITTQPIGGAICENSSITLSVVATGDNLAYQWKKGAVVLNDIGNITGSGTANLNINNADISDAGTYSCEVIGSCGTENSSLANVVVEKQTIITTHPTDAGACEGGNVSFTVLADGVNLNYQWQKDGANLVNGGSISGVNTSLLQITGVVAANAGSYRCIVTGNCGVQNTNPAILDAYINTAITTQPSDVTICETEQISFTLAVNGDNLVYQWKKNGVDISDGGNVSGAETSNLIINNASISDAGIYTCFVSGSCGNENSLPVTASVYPNTIVTTQPQSKITCENEVVSFSIAATGESITYQWQKDGVDLVDGGNIFGSTSSILTINNLIAADAGTYRCVVTGTCSVVNSDAADLIVNVYPSAAGVIIGSANVCQGSSNIQYEVGAITNADHYIWNVPVGVTILSGDSTRVIEVEFSNNELGGNITVQGLNNCGLGVISPALNVTANPIPVANAGADQIICIDTTFLSAVHPGTATGLWTVEDGPAWVQNVNQNNSFISNLREGTNTLIWTVEKNSCSSSDTMVIINNHVNVDAGTDVTICSDIIMLEGSSVPSGATGSWSVVTGNASFDDGNNPITTVNDFATDINVLKWSIAKGGCASYDTVIIDNQRPSQAYAGIDQFLCKDSTNLGANNPVVGTGLWTVITGAATFSDPIDPNTKVTNLSQGDNILRWTISNGICTTIDEVTISNNKLDVNAGVDQILCDRTTNLDAVAPLTGVGNWSVISGSAAFVNNNLHNTTVTGLEQGENILQWNINNNGCISIDSVSITNDSPSDAAAGVDQVLAVDFTTLQANIPTTGIGSWSLISGSAVIADPLLYNTNVTGLALGDNIFRWTITNNSCTLYDDVVITNFMSTATDAGDDQTICSEETDLDGNEPTFGFGEWSVIQGSATFLDNSDPKTTVTGLAKGDNILRWSVWENGWTSDDVVITNDSPTTANAGLDQTLCSDSTFLAGNNPIVGSGLWTVISGAGTFENDTLFNTKVNNLAKGENIFKWTLNNKSCSSSDLVTVINDLPTIADAGIDQISCSNTIALNPNTPSVGVGEWSVLSGSANFSGNTAYNLAKDDNTLRWTIVNNACSSYDDVMITNHEPSDANAGADKIICYDSIALAANIPIVGNGVWTIQSGSASIADLNDPISKVTNLSQGLNIFRWTITYNTCTKFEEVTIHNALIESTTGVDQDICSESTVLEANNPGAGVGAWSVLGGSGAAVFDDINQPDTRVSGLDQGANILRWTITNEICISYSDVVITNSLPTDAFAGPDQELCLDNSILQANTPIVGIGEWSILSGSANLVDANNASSLINNLDYGVNTLRWTITNGSCISSDEVVISNNSTITSNAGIDQVLCEDSTVLYANVPAYGIGQWSVIAGSATFEDNNDYNTKIVDIGKGNNVLKWAISNGGCNSEDQVTITNNSPTTPIAGGDQTICGSSTYLQANIPTTGVGSWTLVSGAASFVNSGQNNTQVTGLNPGSNTLRWTVENNGCTSADDVEIYNDLPYEADAGADFEICGNTSPLYANDPVVGLGEWKVISGNASFNDASRFDATVSDLGFGANTLRWTINYEHCSTYDEIVVTNNKIDVYAGIDQTINESSTLLAASNPANGTGKWTVIGGSGNFNEMYNSITEVSNLGSGLNTFRWSVNINGCISLDDVSITYNVPPAASFVITKSEGCPPLEVYFVNNSLDNLPFTWDFDDGVSSSEVTVKHIFTEPGIYRPSLTVIDDNGEVVTKDTVINVYAQPDASFIIVNEQVYIPEEEAIFINTSTDAIKYEWEFGEGGSSTESDPKYIYDKEGAYDITLHAWSDKDCYDSTTIAGRLEVIESGKIVFPNAFTPNVNGTNGGYYNENDYSNDVFYPVGKGIGNYKLEIFNKWGILVFESRDINIGWDGYFDGELLKEGVYVWKVSGNYNNGKDFQEVGTVLLLR